MATRGAKRPRRPAKAPLTPRETFLGLDISSSCVGWVVFEGGIPTAHGKYPLVGKDHGEKLKNYRTFLLDLFGRYQPGHVVIEKPFAGRNRNTFGVLMMYSGVTLQAHYEALGRELPADQRLIVPLIKRVVRARKGLSYEKRKQFMVELMNRWYGLHLKFHAPDPSKKISDDDIADAYAVVTAFLAQRFPHLLRPDPRSRRRTK